MTTPLKIPTAAQAVPTSSATSRPVLPLLVSLCKSTSRKVDKVDMDLPWITTTECTLTSMLFKCYDIQEEGMELMGSRDAQCCAGKGVGEVVVEVLVDTGVLMELGGGAVRSRPEEESQRALLATSTRTLLRARNGVPMINGEHKLETTIAQQDRDNQEPSGVETRTLTHSVASIPPLLKVLPRGIGLGNFRLRSCSRSARSSRIGTNGHPVSIRATVGLETRVLLMWTSHVRWGMVRGDTGTLSSLPSLKDRIPIVDVSGESSRSSVACTTATARLMLSSESPRGHSGNLAGLLLD